MNEKTVSAEKVMNDYGRNKVPFLFIIDYEKKAPVILPLAEVNPEEILYNFNGITNTEISSGELTSYSFSHIPLSYEKYEKAFHYVMEHLRYANTFLLNLTFPTEINTNLTFKYIFNHSKALYRLWYKDKFVVFSPETFVTIKNNRITSNPMKGTIDASVPNARQVILDDRKEWAEHNTIVDLIRNDLSMVAKKVKVERYRYFTEVKSQKRTLLQVSSEISGEMEPGFNERIGTIIFTLLPAGSICGAPKTKTLEIIREAEKDQRGYYTGIAGYFDGETLDSCVLIRYIEKRDEKLYYRSGGGITAKSELEKEYQELNQKIYVPLV